MKKTTEMTEAAAILRAGGLVAFPTETVYGLGADAHNEAAICRVFAAKGRPFDHPLIVHIAEISQLADWAFAIPERAYRLAEAYWPGPLTLILKKQPQVLDKVTGGQPTVGVRMPNHPVALALLRAFGGGVVAPSANQFTHISPTTAKAVQEELGDKVDLILEGGECEVGLESTILDLSSDVPVILRPGMITASDIEKVMGVPVSLRRQDAPTVRAPGMHHLHYAPMTKTVLVTSAELPDFLLSVTERVAVLQYSHMSLPANNNIEYVPMPMNASHYAHDLYATLRKLDKRGFTLIVIEDVPSDNDWLAIRDRILKASAERAS